LQAMGKKAFRLEKVALAVLHAKSDDADCASPHSFREKIIMRGRMFGVINDLRSGTASFQAGPCGHDHHETNRAEGSSGPRGYSGIYANKEEGLVMSSPREHGGSSNRHKDYDHEDRRSGINRSTSESARPRLQLKPCSKSVLGGDPDVRVRNDAEAVGKFRSCHGSRADQGDWRCREHCEINPAERPRLHLKSRTKPIPDDGEKEGMDKEDLKSCERASWSDTSVWRSGGSSVELPRLQFKPPGTFFADERVNNKMTAWDEDCGSRSERNGRRTCVPSHRPTEPQSHRATGPLRSHRATEPQSQSATDPSPHSAVCDGEPGLPEIGSRRPGGDGRNSWRRPLLQLKPPSASVLEASVQQVCDGPEPGFLLDSGDFIPRHLFKTWPLKPRIGDRLALQLRPQLVEPAEIAMEELHCFLAGFIELCDANPSKACKEISELCYGYMQAACTVVAWTDARVVLSMLSIMQKLVQHFAGDSDVRKVLTDVARSPGFQKRLLRMLPQLLRKGDIDIHSFLDTCRGVARVVPGGTILVNPLALEAARLCIDQKFLPSHWSAKMPTQGRSAVFVKDEQTLKTLQDCLRTNGAHLGMGQDVHEHGCYTRLELACAWRLEHPSLWERYEAECNRIKAEIQERRLDIPSLNLSRGFRRAAHNLPGEVRKEINEVRLLHGTGPDNLLAILGNGMNMRLSPGFLGDGSYFVEDMGKCDQYVTQDKQYGDHKDLHERLFCDGARHPNTAMFYVLVCRVVMGYFVCTKDGETDQHSNAESVFANPTKSELTTIPQVKPAMHYHSLLAESGLETTRYREFIQFHDERIYPEYVIAYNRF